MAQDCESVKGDIVYAVKTLIQRGLNTLTSGNVSYFCMKYGTVLLTPTGVNKDKLSVDDIVEYEIGKGTFRGKFKPTSEYKMHVKVYETNPNIKAIVHAHNPITLAMADALYYEQDREIETIEEFFNKSGLVEVDYVVGKTCVLQYLKPGSLELAREVANRSRECDVIILLGHGVVSFGESITKALERLLGIEYAATYLFHRKLIGGCHNRGFRQKRFTEIS